MAIRLSPPRLLPLTIIVMLLLLSAKAVTFAGEAGAALGLTSGKAPQAPSLPAGPVPASELSVARPLPTGQSAAQQISDSEKTLLLDLRKRREQLDARARSLDERNSVIEASEAALQAKVDRLTSLQEKIDRLDSARKTRRDANWSGLVKIYESMKPRDAATIFDVLDMHILLEVVDRMNERKAAAILAAMQPERARMATQMLAQMRLQQETPISQVSSDPVTKSNSQ